MFPKLDVSNIIGTHLKSLQSYGTVSDINSGVNGKHTLKCFFIFIIVPIIFTYLLYVPASKISDDIISMILNANAIFVGLFLNLIVLLYSMKEKILKLESEEFSKSTLETERIKEDRDTLLTLIQTKKTTIDFMFANVSFQILLSLIIVILTLLHGTELFKSWVAFIDVVIILLMIEVLLGIVLILSRLSDLFTQS